MPTLPIARRTPAWFARFWLPALAYMGLIFTLSAQPHLTPPLRFFGADKVYHALEYFVLGLLVVRALRATRPVARYRTLAFGAVLVVALYAASDELHQYLVPGRSCDAFDWLADVTGGILAPLAYARFGRA